MLSRSKLFSSVEDSSNYARDKEKREEKFWYKKKMVIRSSAWYTVLKVMDRKGRDIIHP